MSLTLPFLSESTIDLSTLPPPDHVTTPTGSWGFFTKLSLPTQDLEKQMIVSYQDVEGVEITKFSDLTQEQIALVNEKLMTIVPKHLDKLTAAHYQHITAGLLIKVTKPLKEPLIIAHEFAHNSYRNTLIMLDEGAECTIIEKFSGLAPVVSHVAEAMLSENAHLTYANTQQCDNIFLARKNATLSRDASIHWFELNAGKDKTFSRVSTDLRGENASTQNLSIYLGEDEQFIDFGARSENIHHHTDANLMTRGVLTGSAQAVYEGVLHIGEEASESTAFQEENCLLLSKDAQIKASPMLYIDNNNVKCSHAATAGRVDKDKLFYLMSRGLKKSEAQRLLIKGFVWPVLERLGSGREFIERQIEPIIDGFAAGVSNE